MQTPRQYNSCKNICKNLQKLQTSSVQKCKYKHKTKHANITMENLQWQGHGLWRCRRVSFIAGFHSHYGCTGFDFFKSGRQIRPRPGPGPNIF